jgi:hypothetical protein
MKYLFSSAKVLEMLVTVSLLLLHRHSAKRSLAVISGFPCTCVNRVSESKHNASLPSPHRPWILSPVPKKPEIYNFILFAVFVSWLCTHKHTLFLLILLLSVDWLIFCSLLILVKGIGSKSGSAVPRGWAKAAAPCPLQPFYEAYWSFTCLELPEESGHLWTFLHPSDLNQGSNGSETGRPWHA